MRRSMIFILFSFSSLIFASTPIQEAKVYLNEQFTKSGMPGMAVAVVHEGRVVLLQGFGIEVAGTNQPMTAASSSSIGSLTKSFTALAIMQLVEAGKLRLEDPVVRHLPWFKTGDAENSGKITVAMLLCHSSGIATSDDMIMVEDPRPDAAEQLVRGLAGQFPARTPGQGFEYSNEGYAVLGVLIEKLSGKSFADYLRDHILKPLDMNESTTDYREIMRGPYLKGHHNGATSFIPAYRGLNSPQYMAAGSMLHCSARDLGNYMLALLHDGQFRGVSLLGKSFRDQLWQGRIPLPEQTNFEEGSYALGWTVSEVDGRTLVHHGGNALTMTSYCTLDPQGKNGVAIISNAGSLHHWRAPSLRHIANNVLHIMQGEPTSDWGLPKEPDPSLNDFELPPEKINQYLGSYITGGLSAEQLEIVQDPNGRLLLSIYQGRTCTGSGVLDFANPARAYLRSVGPSQSLRFEINLKGQCYGLYFGGSRFFKANSLQTNQTPHQNRDGSIRFNLDPDWQVRWTDQGFEAGRPDGFCTIEAFAADTPQAASIPAVDQRSNTRVEVLGTLTWTISSVSKPDGADLIFETFREDVPYYIRFHAPTDQMSIQSQKVLIPFLRSLNL